MQIGFKRIFTFVSVCLLLWLSLRFLLPLFSPFLLGTCLALASEPMVAFLTRRLRLPRPVSSGIGVSMTFALLSMLLLMVCAFVVKELRALTGILPDVELTIQTVPPCCAPGLWSWLPGLPAVSALCCRKM